MRQETHATGRRQREPTVTSRHTELRKNYQSDLQQPMKITRTLSVHALVNITLVIPFISRGAPGDLDTSFNGTGIVVTSFGHGSAMLLQPDGKIVVGGRYYGPNIDFAVARYNPDGSLDTAFNGNGKATVDVAGYDDYLAGMARQSDGKMILVGYCFDGTKYKVGVVRINSDGALDTTFNGTGKVTTSFGGVNDYGFGVALQADGKILVVGRAWLSGYFDAVVARYNTNGSLDTDFGTGGSVLTDFSGGSDEANAVAVQTDGKIVIAGTSGVSGNGYDFSLARYNANGSLDTTFNSTGKVTTSFGTGDDFCEDLVVLSDGRLQVAGTAYNGSNNDFALARYNADGSLDTSFNSTGKVTTPIGSGRDDGRALTVQGDGRVIVAGFTLNGTYNDFSVARYNMNGSLDTTFGGTGMVVTDVLNNDFGLAVAVQPDGKILVAGDGGGGFGIVRYMGDPAEIAVEHPAGTDLVDGGSSVDFGALITGTTSTKIFTIKNTSWVDLTGLGITFDGANPLEFSITESPSAPVTGPTGSTTFTVQFAPTSAGVKGATLHIASNDADENPFDIAITGRGLAPDSDDDSDGVTNLAEVNMAALGFDPLVDSTALRTLLHDNALGFGLYRESDMQGLALGAPLLAKDPDNGNFHLILGVLKSSDMATWNPLIGISPTYDELTGEIDVEITPDGSNPQFFKILGTKP